MGLLSGRLSNSSTVTIFCVHSFFLFKLFNTTGLLLQQDSHQHVDLEGRISDWLVVGCIKDELRWTDFQQF
jgi:hypothetical protein